MSKPCRPTPNYSHMKFFLHEINLKHKRIRQWQRNSRRTKTHADREIRAEGGLRNTWQEPSRKRNIPFWKGLALRPWRKHKAQPPPVSMTPSSEIFPYCGTGKELGQETLTHLLLLSTSVSMFVAICLRRINPPPPSIVLRSWNSPVIHFKGLRSFKHVRGLMRSQLWDKPEDSTWSCDFSAQCGFKIWLYFRVNYAYLLNTFVVRNTMSSLKLILWKIS